MIDIEREAMVYQFRIGDSGPWHDCTREKFDSFTTRPKEDMVLRTLYTKPSQQCEAEPDYDPEYIAEVLEDYCHLQTSGEISGANRYPVSDVMEQVEWLTAATAGGVPEGWASRFVRLMGEIQSELEDAQDDPIPAELWSLWRELLAAAPSPGQPKPRNRYGVDAPYFHGKLSIILRDIENYTPDELARSLARLVVVADKDVLAESEFTLEQGKAWMVPAYLTDALSFYAMCSHMTYPVEDGKVALDAINRFAKESAIKPAQGQAAPEWIRCSERLPEPRRSTRKTPNGILAKHTSGRITQFRDVTEDLVTYMRNGPRKPTKYEKPIPTRIVEWLDLDATNPPAEDE